MRRDQQPPTESFKLVLYPRSQARYSEHSCQIRANAKVYDVERISGKTGAFISHDFGGLVEQVMSLWLGSGWFDLGTWELADYDQYHSNLVHRLPL